MKKLFLVIALVFLLSGCTALYVHQYAGNEMGKGLEKVAALGFDSAQKWAAEEWPKVDGAYEALIYQHENQIPVSLTNIVAQLNDLSVKAASRELTAKEKKYFLGMYANFEIESAKIIVEKTGLYDLIRTAVGL